MSKIDIKKVRDEASRLYQTIVEDPLVKREGTLLEPIPIVNVKGDTEAWFVGVGVNELLAGFFQIDIQLNLMRYSSFQRKTSSLDGCPKIDTWTNSDTIIKNARKSASSEEKLGEPFLTYDGNINRIAWGVPTQTADNQTRIIYVAGEFVYTKSTTI
jgi:hypothetical protein